MDLGAEVTKGGLAEFQKCCQFFSQKADKTDDLGLGDQDAAEIDEFIGRYENSAQITQVLWQLYYLKLEIESEQTQINEIQEEIE
jgi:hypothetical protein